MTDKEFTEIAKEAMLIMLDFDRDEVWEQIIYKLDKSNISPDEMEYWCDGGDGDAIVDKIFQKLIDIVKEM